MSASGVYMSHSESFKYQIINKYLCGSLYRDEAAQLLYRPRMPQEGLLLQMDGSHHKFNGKDEWCLISAIDDATSIPYAEFFNGETTLACIF
jgi:hypothetical protein